MQIDFLELNKINKFKLKKLFLSNFKRLHREYSIKLTKGINILMPNYDLTKIELSPIGIDFDPLDTHVDSLYMNDFINMIELLRYNRDFEVWDYSMFGSNKEIQISAIIEQDGTNREFLRKQKYRGDEKVGEIIGYTKGGKPRISKINFKNYEEEVIDGIFKDIAIYPKDVPPLLRVQYTKNFNYLLEKFPLLNIKRLVKDINFILYSYQIGCKVVEKKGEIEIVNLRNIDILLDQDKEIRKSFNKLSKKVDDLTIDILFNTKQKYLDKHLELAILIALENQLNNDAIVLSNGFLQGVYGEDLDLCLLMLVEFINNDQQVILSYDSPYDYTLIEQVKNTINYFNKGFGENIYNPIEFNERYTTEEEWNNKSITIAARELVARSEMNYETKIKLSKKIIIDALSKVNDYSKMALGFSYGKDSLCLLIILKNVIDDINKNSNFKIPYPKLVFCNSGVEFPETYAYKLKFDKILKGWGFEIYTTKPKERFWDIIEKEGFPMFGKAIRKNKNPEIFEKIEKLGIKTCGNQCCLKLKEIPSSELYKKLGIEMVFVGILAEESYTRKTRWYELGDTYWNKTEGLFKCQPLIHFSEDDVWKTIKDSGVPYNPTYDMGYWKTDKNGEEVFVKYGRTGCWPCSMNIQFSGNNIEMLRNTHPKLWDLIMNKKGLGKEIFKFKHYISEEQWSEREIHMLEAYLERKPCHFDTTDWKGIV